MAKTATGKGAKPKHKKRTYTSFATPIWRMIKQIHPSIGITKKSMVILNSFAIDLLKKLGTEASSVCAKNRKKTLSARDVQTAAKLTLPGDIATYAIAEGAKAVIRYETRNNV